MNEALVNIGLLFQKQNLS